MRGPLERLLRRTLYCREPPRLDGIDVVMWWETRRLFYNVIVGVVGIVSAILLIICSVIADALIHDPIGMPDPPMFGVVAAVLYGIMANICYTGGWMAELLLLKV